MQTRFITLLFKSLLTALTFVSCAIQAQVLQSPKHKVNFLELYTSQGCSSCPPAEKWLSRFQSDKRLWNEIIPINFHVDYWDYLGWQDPFARASFSQRQRLYAAKKQTHVVATPGFMLNGKGWFGWFDREPAPLVKKPAPLNIKADIKNQMAEITVSHTPNKPQYRNLDVHVAILGFDIKTRVPRGENRNRTLEDNFIVLAHAKGKLAGNSLKTALPNVPAAYQPAKQAVIIWVAQPNELSPIQAVGGWLEK